VNLFSCQLIDCHLKVLLNFPELSQSGVVRPRALRASAWAAGAVAAHARDVRGVEMAGAPGVGGARRLDLPGLRAGKSDATGGHSGARAVAECGGAARAAQLGARLRAACVHAVQEGRGWLRWGRAGAPAVAGPAGGQVELAEDLAARVQAADAPAGASEGCEGGVVGSGAAGRGAGAGEGEGDLSVIGTSGRGYLCKFGGKGSVSRGLRARVRAAFGDG
jgi:hypothetical protein